MAIEPGRSLDDLFNDALALPPEERPAFLSGVCGEDDLLVTEVQSLLDAHERAGGFLPEVEAGPNGENLDAARVDRVGERVGSFRVEELLAVGGMGAVYRAVRDDDQFRQEVAIKLIHRDIASPAMVRRFQWERQALSDLNHPGIARLLDGGATDDGLPFLIMEYIPGKPIDRFCDDARMNLRDRLNLFLKVCDAVGYAHRHLLVHRDLKPANILVPGDGQPKLLDFGIAKLLQADSMSGAGDNTCQWMRLVTPRYASPEQLRDDRVTVASDVYSLGLILYELLTGLPARIAGQIRTTAGIEMNIAVPSAAFHRSVDSVAETARRAEARSSSREQLRRHLRGDLDAIVAKATRENVAERYNSVEQLVNDIRDYLDGRPVTASEFSFSYKAVKFIRRNAVTVSLFTLVFVLLTSAAVVSGLLTVRARRAEARADADRNAAVVSSARAQRVNRLLEETILSANPYRKGSTVTIVDVLNDLSERAALALADDPIEAAEMHYKLGAAYANLWKWRDVLAHASAAVELTRETPPINELALADRLHLLGRAMTFTGQPGAEQLAREALEIRTRILGSDHPAVGDSKNCLAYALWANSRPPEPALADALYRDGIATLRRSLDGPNQRLAIGLLSYSSLLSSLNRTGEADKLVKSAWEMYRQLPDHEDRYMVACQVGYAATLERAGRLEEARELMTDALQMVPDGLEDTCEGVDYRHLVRLHRQLSRADEQ
jgi:serine/threonine protein kinase